MEKINQINELRERYLSFPDDLRSKISSDEISASFKKIKTQLELDDETYSSLNLFLMRVLVGIDTEQVFTSNLEKIVSHDTVLLISNLAVNQIFIPMKSVIDSTKNYTEESVNQPTEYSDLPVPKPPQFLSPKIELSRARIEQIRPMPHQGTKDPYREIPN